MGKLKSKRRLQKTYARARKIKDTISCKITNSCKYLSIGMSNDYEIAVLEGATHLRIGQAIFGQRPYQQ